MRLTHEQKLDIAARVDKAFNGREACGWTKEAWGKTASGLPLDMERATERATCFCLSGRIRVDTFHATGKWPTR